MPSVQEVQEFKAKEIWEVYKGVYVIDLGQHISGWCRLTLDNPPDGTNITLRHGEILDKGAGFIYTGELRKAKA